MKKAYLLIGLLVILIIILISNCIQQKKIKWNKYSNSYYSDYIISYPNYMKVFEVGQNNRRAIISTQDYKIDMTNGIIISGFKVDISVNYFDSLDDLFYCHKEKLNIEKNCLLANMITQLVDYQKGEVKTESVTVDGYPGIKYEFISSVGKNNNIGLVVKKDNKYYVSLIAYRTYEDMELFNQILDSFKFKR